MDGDVSLFWDIVCVMLSLFIEKCLKIIGMFGCSGLGNVFNDV